jgi:hypothetical protein
VILVASVFFGGLSLAGAAPRQIAPISGRSSEIATLIEQARSTRSSAPIDTVLERLQRESDPSVFKYATADLLRRATPMTRPQKKRLLSLVRDPSKSFLPRRLPLPETGPIEVRYYSGFEFFRAEVNLLAQHGFTLTEANREATATRGRLHVIVRHEPSDGDVFRDLTDPAVHAVIYSGHSELGGVVERGLQQPGIDRQVGHKLVAMMQCKGIQTLSMLEAHLPSAHHVTTIGYSNAPDDQTVIHGILDGLEHGDTYAQIRQRVRSVGSNYLFPDRIATLQYQDFDRNGELDGHQLARGAAMELYSDKQRGALERLVSGVHYLRSMNAYYAEEERSAVFTREQSKVPIVPVGLARQAGPDVRQVTQIRETKINGQRGFEVALDPRYANVQKELVAVAAVYELQLKLQSALLGKNDERAKLRALGFAGEYLQRMYGASVGREGQRALVKLAALKGLPHGINMGRMPDNVHELSETWLDHLGTMIDCWRQSPQCVPAFTQ